jgi:hypothetical protein
MFVMHHAASIWSSGHAGLITVCLREGRYDESWSMLMTNARLDVCNQRLMMIMMMMNVFTAFMALMMMIGAL